MPLKTHLLNRIILRREIGTVRTWELAAAVAAVAVAVVEVAVVEVVVAAVVVVVIEVVAAEEAASWVLLKVQWQPLNSHSRQDGRGRHQGTAGKPGH